MQKALLVLAMLCFVALGLVQNGADARLPHHHKHRKHSHKHKSGHHRSSAKKKAAVSTAHHRRLTAESYAHQDDCDDDWHRDHRLYNAHRDYNKRMYAGYGDDYSAGHFDRRGIDYDYGRSYGSSTYRYSPYAYNAPSYSYAPGFVNDDYSPEALQSSSGATPVTSASASEQSAPTGPAPAPTPAATSTRTDTNVVAVAVPIKNLASPVPGAKSSLP